MAGQNIDVTNYQSWRKIVTPSGREGYIVPGSGLVYDPFMSRSRGQNVFFQNNQAEVDARQQAEDERRRAIKRQEEASSPLGQAIPIVGAVGGALAARAGMNYLSSPLEQAQLAIAQKTLGATGGQAAAGSAGGITAAPAVAAESAAPLAGSAGSSFLEAAAPAEAIGQNADGSFMFAGDTLPAPSGFSLSGIGSAGNYLLPAAGALGAFNLLSSENGPARGALQGAASGAAMGSYFGPPGAILGGAIGGVAGLAESFFDNPSTKEIEKKRWGNLADSGITDAQSAFLANHPVGDTSIYQDGPRKGQKWNFENALEDAKADPSHFRLVYGNYDTFGNDWSSYAPDQQDAIVSRLAHEGLYSSSKGDILIKNKERARQIKDEVLSGKVPSAVTPAVALKTQGITTPPPMATQPGIPRPIRSPAPVAVPAPVQDNRAANMKKFMDERE